MQMKMVTVGLVWLFLSHMTVAQATQQGAEGSAGKIRLDNGTEVRLLLMDAISSKTAKAGDSIRLRVLDDVKVDNLVIIANRAPAMATSAMASHSRNGNVRPLFRFIDALLRSGSPRPRPSRCSAGRLGLARSSRARAECAS